VASGAAFLEEFSIWCKFPLIQASLPASLLIQPRDACFVAFFLTFLGQCVDYSKIPRSKSLGDIMVPQCTRHMSWIWNLGLWLFFFYVIWKTVQYVVDIRRLIQIRDFYIHLLEIPEQEMQTISWQDIVARIMAFRDANPRTATNITPSQRRWIGSQSKERLDAHDIANRIMRQENYLIAMINKDILNFTLPIPVLRGHQFFSQTLEWYIKFGVLDMVFNDVGQVHQQFLRADQRGLLSQKLRARFFFSGVMCLIFAPFFAAIVLMMHFMRHFTVSRRCLKTTCKLDVKYSNMIVGVPEGPC
jgi:autophagy-related protein 9